MDIKGDVMLKGGDWRVALDALAPFFSITAQPNYSVYVISMSIGIMYDKQLDMAGEESEEYKESRASVPRTVLHPHNNDLDFLFQTAILSSDLITYTEKERMQLAFDPACSIAFNKLEFLTKFANFGVQKLLEKVSDEPTETMQNIKNFLAATVEGYNYEIYSISDEDLSIDDLD